MTMRSVLAIALTLLVSSGAARGEALSAVAGRYAIQPSSQIAFSVGQVGGGGISGRFPQFSGNFVLHPEDITRSSVAFTLNPGSVVTGQPRVDTFLRSSAVFDAADHPAIKFQTIRVIPVDADTARIDGILSARGKSHQETFVATLLWQRGRDIAFHVVADIFRSNYGMDVGTPIYSNVVHFDMVLRGHRS